MGDHENYYDIVCRERFDRHDKKIDDLDDKVGKLNTTVNNGLVHRVSNVNKLLWILIGAIVVEGIVSRFIG